MTVFVDRADDEPVFPITSCADHQFCGMGLRDYFAAKVLPAFVTFCGEGISFGPDSPDNNLRFANAAYAMADAMMKARKS